MLLKNDLNNLKKIIKTDNVLTTKEERYCYSTDSGNNNYDSQIPDLVVFVETIEDVQKILKYANENKIPIVARGAGTNMVGACVCNKGGIVLNFSKMNKILEINETNMTATVQPGVVLGDLKLKAENKNLFFPPDPSNYKVSTIGGAIAQSSAGATAFRYGSIKDYILSLKVVTADGNLVQLGVGTSKDSVGYHLNQLIVGSEGTLAIVVEAVLKLLPKPEMRGSVFAFFNDLSTALFTVTKILNSNLYPTAIDFMDNNSIRTLDKYLNVGLNINANCLVMFEFDGDTNSVKNNISVVNQIVLDNGACEVKCFLNSDEAEDLWELRRASYAATTKLAPDVISDDIVVPNDKLKEMIEFCNKITEENNLKMCLVGHIGNGNIHPQFALNIENDKEYRTYLTVKSKIYQKACELGGTISAEHGIGLEKLSYIDSIIDPKALEFMRQIKMIFDPNNILNPGKVFKL